METIPPLYNSTYESSPINNVRTSENPYLPYMLPPTVARFLNCTPTICLSASLAQPFVYSLNPLWFSNCLSDVIHPILNSSSVSSILSSPNPDISIAVLILLSPIRIHIMPPTILLAFFWLSS